MESRSRHQNSRRSGRNGRSVGTLELSEAGRHVGALRCPLLGARDTRPKNDDDRVLPGSATGEVLTGIFLGVPRHGRSASVLRAVPSVAKISAPDTRAPLDDRVLVKAVQAGDVTVASSLCDRVGPQVDRTIKRLLGSRDADRDDVAQLALIELVSTIGRYRGECSLDSWAQTVTSHVVFKHIRRRQLERSIFTDLLAEDVPELSGAAQPDVRTSTQELLARVATHLDEMSAARAWAFVMHDVLGYDLREIARMTKTSVAATQSRLVRGRRELHNRISRDPTLVDLMKRMEEPQ
jgi:RNA polymerase sigma factor (sigma-70 family)